MPYEPGGDLHIKVGGQYIKRARTVKYLGMLIDEDMKFRSHIGKVASTISRHIGIISRARHVLDTSLHILLYNALVLPYITYCLVIWGSNYESNLQPIITAQKRAIRLVGGAGRLAHTSPLFCELKILKLVDLLKYQLILILHEKLYGYLPHVIASKFTLCDKSRATRNKQHFNEVVHSVNGSVVPNYRLHNYRLFSLFCQAPRVWNTIIASKVLDMHDIPPSKRLFKKCIKLIFTDKY